MDKKYWIFITILLLCTMLAGCFDANEDPAGKPGSETGQGTETFLNQTEEGQTNPSSEDSP